MRFIPLNEIINPSKCQILITTTHHYYTSNIIAKMNTLYMQENVKLNFLKSCIRLKDDVL
jgi:hypothetical protein